MLTKPDKKVEKQKLKPKVVNPQRSR